MDDQNRLTSDLELSQLTFGDRADRTDCVPGHEPPVAPRVREKQRASYPGTGREGDRAPPPALCADDFDPPRALANAHLQTLLASVALRAPWIALRSAGLRHSARPLVLAAGQGVRLLANLSCHGLRPDRRRPLATLIHGWLGCQESRYLQSCAAHLYQSGCNVLRLNLRDHGGSETLNREMFHSCRLDEVVAALVEVQHRIPASDHLLGGFSLGGNFALRVARQAPAAGLELRQVVAVCPVLEPAHTLRALEQGWFVYRHYFLRRWRRALAAKRASFPQHYADLRLQDFSNLTDMTAAFARRYAGFASLGDYLRGYALTGEVLQGLDTPAALIMAEDDPVNPSADLQRLGGAPRLLILRTRRGGHCGFVDDLTGPSWADRRMAELFAWSRR